MTALPLVPVPLHVSGTSEAPFHLDPGTRVVVSDGSPREVGDVLAGRLRGIADGPVPVATDDGDAPGAVVLRLTGDPGALGWPPPGDPPPHGAYRLDVAPQRVVITATDRSGLLHGAATLAQLAGARDDRTVPAGVVVDGPRFAWRGLSLDVARHFVDVTGLRAVIDVMTDLKLNVLHLHLTDDQGWRLQVPSRPRLTEVSSATAVGGDPGGCYSTEDYAHIQEYAAARGVMVVPEIDLPGHINAALHAYGELTPSGQPAPPCTGMDVGFSRLHAALPATETFLRDVLSDVAAMTLGPYVHIGGDEALAMTEPEYARLVALAAGHLHDAGKTVVGWQEIVRAPLPPGTLVQYWDERADAAEVTAAARAGAAVLLSPATRAYLDMKYDAGTPLGLEWAGHIEVRDAYDWEPLEVLPDLPPGCVVGVEAVLWSETIRGIEDLFVLLLPRLAAFAEVAWSAPERRGWDGFADRLPAVARRWEADGLSWYRSPQVRW